MNDLLTALKAEFSGEVANDQPTLERYASDASIFRIVPQAVVYPKNTEELQALVVFADKHEGVSLTARSAGTDMSGGPLNNSIIVDFTKYFTHIGTVQGNTLRVQPGVYYRDFEKVTLASNMLMPSYPASREICTVGGMVANNSGGEKSLSYGKTERYVKNLGMVLSDGKAYQLGPLSQAQLRQKLAQQDFEGALYQQLYNLINEHQDLLAETQPKVSKNSAGYNLWRVWDGNTFDLSKLVVGSQGTLGLVTDITFSLVTPKPYSRLLVIFLPGVERIADMIDEILACQPESFESYDDNTLRLALRFFPELVTSMKSNILRLGWQFLPEFWMMLTGGMPKLVAIAEFTGDSLQEVRQKLTKAQAAIASFQFKTHVTTSDEENKKYWTIRRESFNLLRHHVQGKHTAPFIDDLIVPPLKLPQFFVQLEAIIKHYPLKYTVAGHIGDGNFHIIPLMDMADPTTPAIIKELSEKVYKLVISFGGSITAEHNDGLIRTPFLEEMYGKEIMELFAQVKHIFDPNNIFNPGKKVGTSFDQAMRYLRTSF